MSISVVAVHDSDSGDSATGVFDVTFDNSYPTNGYPVNGATFSRKAIHSLIPVQKGTMNRLINYDPTGSGAGAIRIWTAINTEAAGASDQSTISCRVRVVGPHV